MTQRLKDAGLALAILVLGLGLIVAVTEYEARADTGGPRLLTAADVTRALRDQDIIVERIRTVRHPLLGVQGTTFSFGASSIEVYVYPTVSGRVTDEQIIQRQVMNLQALTADGDQPVRITSARNVLLTFHAESPGAAASIHAAAHSLTSMD